MNLLPLPSLKDNYIWLVHDGTRALVVDPGDAQPVLAALDAHQLQLDAILVTHHHADHTAGIEALVKNATAGHSIPVYGPAHEKIVQVSHPLEDGDVINCLGIPWQVMQVPGHTLGHIVFYTPDFAGKPLLFSGDTLFCAGCGRLFEGTPRQMQHSLERLAALPDDTLVCCTHEYTLSNLKFAMAVEPNNQDVIYHHAHCLQLRQAQKPTLPSCIALERKINPFLRSHIPAVALAAQRLDPTISLNDTNAVWAALRRWKNEFV